MDIVYSEQFTLLDYILFSTVIIVSAAIGLYYAIKARHVDITVDEYLLGGRKMSIFPICCSLLATSVSGSSIIGIPAETYAYGTYTWLYSFGSVVMTLLMHFIFLEVFHGLQLTSTFEYFEMRFNRKVRRLASGIFLICGLLVLPLIVYIPALTFQRVTGINVYVTVIILSIICACYTSIGGFKAVVWTDVVQLTMIVLCMVVLMVVGTQSVGGLGAVYEAADRGGRIVIANLEIWNSRGSFLPMIISYPFLIFYQFGLNQTTLQRYLSLSNITKMKTCLWILCILYILVCIAPVLLGVIIYANYETCDPAKAGLIRKMDQILPHFIMEKANMFQGFNGIFIAGIFSASLSTTSSYLNAMSGILYEDFISLRYRNLSSKASNRILKSLVLLFGLLQIVFVVYIEKMGMIVQIAGQVLSLQTAPMITLFGLGILVPKANSKGAISGALSAMVGLLVLILGSLHNKREPTMLLRTDGCGNVLNSTLNSVPKIFDDKEDNIFWIFKLNFSYYGFVGSFLGLTVGYLISLATGGERVKNQKLIAKFLRNQEAEEGISLRNREKVDMCD